MSSLESTPAKLLVPDVAALDDAQLAQFMVVHRRPSGDFELPIEGWDKLAREERARLAERLLKYSNLANHVQLRTDSPANRGPPKSATLGLNPDRCDVPYAGS